MYRGTSLSIMAVQYSTVWMWYLNPVFHWRTLGLFPFFSFTKKVLQWTSLASWIDFWKNTFLKWSCWDKGRCVFRIVIVLWEGRPWAWDVQVLGVLNKELSKMHKERKERNSESRDILKWGNTPQDGSVLSRLKRSDNTELYIKIWHEDQLFYL